MRRNWAHLAVDGLKPIDPGSRAFGIFFILWHKHGTPSKSEGFYTACLRQNPFFMRRKWAHLAVNDLNLINPENGRASQKTRDSVESESF